MNFDKNDIIEMVKKSVKAILKENREDELKVWHGSNADFNQFDLKFIGTGEGSQAYGYGVYVTNVQTTARMYSVIATYRNKNKRGSVTSRDYNIKKWRGCINAVAKTLYFMNKGMTIERAPKYLARKIEEAGADKAEIARALKCKSRGDIRSLEGYYKFKATMSFINERFLYVLDIPDSGYLPWNGGNKSLILRLFNWFSQHGFDVEGIDVNSIETFGDLYSALRGWEKGSKKIEPKNPQLKISAALYKLGFKGISVPTGYRNTMDGNRKGDGRGTNYVIFNPKDIKIIKKERF